MESSSKESLFFSDLDYVDDSKKDPNESLKKLVTLRLKECGWFDQLAMLVRTTLDELGNKPTSYRAISEQIIPKAKLLVPKDLRRELESRVRDALENRHK